MKMKLKVVKPVRRKVDGPNEDYKAAKQLEDAAYTALMRAQKLFKNAGDQVDGGRALIHLKGVQQAIRALDEI